MPTDYQLGKQYIEEGQCEKGIDVLTKRLEQFPGDCYALCYRGRAYIETGMPEAGVADLRLALRGLPFNAELYNALASFYEAQGYPTVAYLYYQGIVERNPQDDPISSIAKNRITSILPSLDGKWFSRWLVEAYEYSNAMANNITLGMMKVAAQQKLAKGEDLNSDEFKEDMLRFESSMKHIIASRMRDWAYENITLANELMAQDLYRTAIPHLIEALYLVPDDATLLGLLASAYYALDAYEPCLRVIVEIEKLDSHNPDFDKDVAKLKADAQRHLPRQA